MHKPMVVNGHWSGKTILETHPIPHSIIVTESFCNCEKSDVFVGGRFTLKVCSGRVREYCCVRRL